MGHKAPLVHEHDAVESAILLGRGQRASAGRPYGPKSRASFSTTPLDSALAAPLLELASRVAGGSCGCFQGCGDLACHFGRLARDDEERAADAHVQRDEVEVGGV